MSGLFVWPSSVGFHSFLCFNNYIRLESSELRLYEVKVNSNIFSLVLNLVIYGKRDFRSIRNVRTIFLQKHEIEKSDKWGRDPRSSGIQFLNNRMFLSRNYRLIVATCKCDVLKTNICPRSYASRTNMLVLRTSNIQRRIAWRHRHSIVFIVHH